KIIDYHKARGTGAIVAQILAENAPMLRLARRCGFSVGKSDEPDVMECVLRLGG
ncbi:MAG: hypothetical protein HQL39_09350, partial [Alphaproteobacteria bacterium]|nr:hypothetical protein [Alphaproteobacteria bacterium]